MKTSKDFIFPLMDYFTNTKLPSDLVEHFTKNNKIPKQLTSILFLKSKDKAIVRFNTKDKFIHVRWKLENDQEVFVRYKKSSANKTIANLTVYSGSDTDYVIQISTREDNPVNNFYHSLFGFLYVKTLAKVYDS